MTAPAPRDELTLRATPPVQYARMLAVMAVATAGCFVFRSRLNPTDVAMVLLLGVVFVASRSGRGPAVAASFLGIAAFDFLFVPPYYTFTVAESSFVFTFAVMLLVALTMSRLTATIREHAIEAQESAMRSAALFELSRELAEAASKKAVVEIATRHIGRAGAGKAELVLTEETGIEDGAPKWPTAGMFEDTTARVAGNWAFANGEAAGNGTRHLAAGDVCVAPIRAPTRILGVVAVRPDALDRVLTGAECRTIQALADQAALTLELGTPAQRWEQRVREQARGV
jgi:two-component system, OmpR family, sensor histidine kinase KdpD